MPKQKRYTFVISTEYAEKQFTGFVDMLRYDNAVVIEADTSLLVLQTKDHEPTNMRWQSFGIYILAQQAGDFPDIRYLRHEAAERIP